MSEVVDLDALAPKPVIIKYGGKEFEVNPPDVSQIMRLGRLGEQMKEIDSLPADRQSVLLEDLCRLIKDVIPELDDMKISSVILLKLVEIINSMAVPPDVKSLQEEGISFDGPKEESTS